MNKYDKAIYFLMGFAAGMIITAVVLLHLVKNIMVDGRTGFF